MCFNDQWLICIVVEALRAFRALGIDVAVAFAVACSRGKRSLIS